MLGKFPVVYMGTLTQQEHKHNGLDPRQLLAYITRSHSVESSVVGTFTA